MTSQLEKELSPQPYLEDVKKNKAPYIVAGIAGLVVVGLLVNTYFSSKAHKDEGKDLKLEGYLQGSGFNRAGLPIDVSGGATHLVVSCTPSTTDLETITNPKIEFNIDESGNAYLIDEPLKDAAGTALGEAVVIPIPLISPEDVSAFIAGDLTKFCIAVTN